jgi:hypothetical protein
MESRVSPLHYRRQSSDLLGGDCGHCIMINFLDDANVFKVCMTYELRRLENVLTVVAIATQRCDQLEKT